ncbi:MAG: thioredoxin family protein [Woeseiaceae bacterium]|nr:thioredoxin family protein [Woeseiaceae bacterium]
MPGPYSRLLPIFTLALCVSFLAWSASAAETDPDGRLFAPSADALADVEQALARAGDNDRLGLVVLGANWCHDSRALAARLNRSPLAEVIEENYELVFVDVGFYEKGGNVLQQFGVPQFYATPTALIINPSTRQVVDNEERHLWSNAYKVDMASSVDYFEKWATNDAKSAPASAELQQLYAEIDQFEQQLAERVAAGYAVVGPMLKAHKADNAPSDFEARWDELAGFRMAIPGAIGELRDEARRRVAAGEDDIQLEFPAFPLLSWESN